MMTAPLGRRIALVPEQILQSPNRNLSSLAFIKEYIPTPTSQNGFAFLRDSTTSGYSLSVMQSSTKLTSKTFSETLTFILPHHRSPRANTVVAGSLSVQGPASYSRRNVSTKPPSGNMTVLKL